MPVLPAPKKTSGPRPSHSSGGAVVEKIAPLIISIKSKKNTASCGMFNEFSHKN